MSKSAEELTQHAMSLLADNQLPEARTAFLHICELTPNDTQAWVIAATICGELGIKDEAKEYLETAIKLEPDHEQAYLALASIYNDENNYNEALSMCESALNIDKEYPEAWLVHSAILGKLGRYEEAGESAKQAIAYAPDLADAHVNLGNSLNALNKHKEAISVFEHAIRLQPNLGKAHISLAESLASTGRYTEAKVSYTYAESLIPGDPGLLRIKGRILEREGHYQEAFDLLHSSISTDAFDASAAITLANAAKQLGRSEDAVKILESVLAQNNFLAFNRREIYMALGHLYDKLKNYDKAFENLTKAHQLVDTQFNASKYKTYIDLTTEFFSKHRINTLAKASNASELPIFIVGMPRSGTTLAEQILSSHGNIDGAGELTDIFNIATALTEASHEKNYPNCLADTTTETLDRHADTYFQRLRQISSSAQRIVDKMPGNFIHLGLIQQLFPNARVIHCTRDPIDTCLSCYFQSFLGHTYLHDLRDLGSYYVQYKRLMRHWSSVLSLPIMEVRYEDLVANTEAMSKKMIEFCGLPWDENCLNFHESTRAVLTASYQQVKKPIYKSSLNRWKNYEVHLQPLIQELNNLSA